MVVVDQNPKSPANTFYILCTNILYTILYHRNDDFEVIVPNQLLAFTEANMYSTKAFTILSTSLLGLLLSEIREPHLGRE